MSIQKSKSNNILDFKGDSFISKLSCNLETFCSLANNSDDFEVSSCENGYLEFIVPLKWLVKFLNSNSSARGEKILKINNLEDLNDWHSQSTYYETEYVFRAAEDEGILLYDPIVHDCGYCEKYSV